MSRYRMSSDSDIHRRVEELMVKAEELGLRVFSSSGHALVVEDRREGGRSYELVDLECDGSHNGAIDIPADLEFKLAFETEGRWALDRDASYSRPTQE